MAKSSSSRARGWVGTVCCALTMRCTRWGRACLCRWICGTAHPLRTLVAPLPAPHARMNLDANVINANGKPAILHAPYAHGGAKAGLKRKRRVIEEAVSMLVVGGGAAGIQFASDIAVVHWHPTLAKRVAVTLLHSRARLLLQRVGGCIPPSPAHAERARCAPGAGGLVSPWPCSFFRFRFRLRHRRAADGEDDSREGDWEIGREVEADLVLLADELTSYSLTTRPTPNTALIALLHALPGRARRHRRPREPERAGWGGCSRTRAIPDVAARGCATLTLDLRAIDPESRLGRVGRGMQLGLCHRGDHGRGSAREECAEDGRGSARTKEGEEKVCTPAPAPADTTDNGEAPGARNGESLLAENELLDAEADTDSSDSYSLHRDHANRRAADADTDAEHNLIEETAVLIPETDEEPLYPVPSATRCPRGTTRGHRGRSRGGINAGVWAARARKRRRKTREKEDKAEEVKGEGVGRGEAGEEGGKGVHSLAVISALWLNLSQQFAKA
ncbi:hypothetical protein B0H13DRAFT_2558906 [Mycena leptocephala]|nr:hypothetical protein B0H13DRAFT_2558906 [Mycena leptocephala]